MMQISKLSRFRMQRWDAARAASQRSIRAYKPVGPVDPCGPQDVDSASVTLKSGERLPYKQWLRLRTSDISCPGCGYHVCSCKPPEVSSMPFTYRQAPMLPRTLAGRIDLLGALGTFAPVDRHAALGLLLAGDPLRGKNLFCAACGALPPVGASLRGAFCTKCIDKADAEAKPFRDALDEKLKALMGLVPLESTAPEDRPWAWLCGEETK